MSISKNGVIEYKGITLDVEYELFESMPGRKEKDTGVPLEPPSGVVINVTKITRHGADVDFSTINTTHVEAAIFDQLED